RNRRTFWSAPQLTQSQILESMQKASVQGLTLKIPITNELPHTIPNLVQTIGQVEQILASRLLLSSPPSHFVSSIDDCIDTDQLIRDLHEKGDALKFHQAQHLFEAGSHDEAREKAQTIVLDSESSVPAKFAALRLVYHTEFLKIGRHGTSQGSLPKLSLDFSKRLQQLTKKGPVYLKFFALILRKAAELSDLTFRYFGLYMNWKVHSAGGDPFWVVQ